MLLGCIMIGTLSFAQKSSKDPRQLASRQSEIMKNVLALNETQYAAVKNINEHYADKISALKVKDRSVRGKKDPELKNLRKQKSNELNAVLSADQQVTWKNYKKHKKAIHKKQKGQGKVGNKH